MEEIRLKNLIYRHELVSSQKGCTKPCNSELHFNQTCAVGSVLSLGETFSTDHSETMKDTNQGKHLLKDRSFKHQPAQTVNSDLQFLEAHTCVVPAAEDVFTPALFKVQFQ